MKKLVIFGAGVMARMAHFYFSTDSDYEVAAFAVHEQYKSTDEYLGLPLVGQKELPAIYPPDEYSMFVALSYAGMNQPRAATYQQMKDQGYRLASYISSHCTYLSQQPPGDNCLILEDNTIQPFAKIGNNVFLWSGNHIGHDATVEDHCFFAGHAGVGGFTRVGRFCFFSIQASVINNIVLGERTMLGAGTVVLKNTEPGSVYVAERARKLKIPSHRIRL